MLLKIYMQENPVSGFEVVENVLALSVVSGGVCTELDVDTSNIEAGTKLKTVNEFVVDGDMVYVAGITIDASKVQVMVYPYT